ncbi:hypothetical protein ACS5PK_12105 [Roseateles sp. DB2]|uniref:hypothetical protein n=1 Tax=Roseateles sp. DB2 TaxID=3453717 RepID=UPI003EEBE609
MMDASLERLGWAQRPLPGARPLELLTADESLLVIQGCSLLSFDRRRWAVTNAGRLVVSFDDIVQVVVVQVVVVHHRDHEDMPEHWAVVLQVGAVSTMSA